MTITQFLRYFICNSKEELDLYILEVIRKINYLNCCNNVTLFRMRFSTQRAQKWVSYVLNLRKSSLRFVILVVLYGVLRDI